MHKIAIIEDEEMLRDTYQLILSSGPYIVDVAPDGEHGLRLCGKQTYDLILLDLMMPRVDGVTFLERYARSGLPPTKIIILSNVSSGDELAKAMTLGAHKNVVKADMSPRDLLNLVEHELSS